MILGFNFKYFKSNIVIEKDIYGYRYHKTTALPSNVDEITDKIFDYFIKR